MSTRITRLGATALCGALATAIIGISASPATADRISVRWATSDTGSYGYSVAAIMTDVLEEALPDEYTVTVHPYPATTAAMNSVMHGESDIAYTADVGMRQLYDGEGPHEDFEPDAGYLVHTFYAYPMETFMVVPSDSADDFASYADFDGREMFYTPAGYMNWLNSHRMMEALGYDPVHVEIDSATTADALEGGTVVGAASYTTAGRSLPTWWQEAELRVDITVVNPSDDEIARWEEAGLTPAYVDPEEAFEQDVGVSEIIGIPILFGYNVRADADHDFVKAMLDALYADVDRLADLDPGFGPLADDFIGMQVAGISANPDIPVHSGMAEFLQEHDAWNDDWTIAD